MDRSLDEIIAEDTSVSIQVTPNSPQLSPTNKLTLQFPLAAQADPFLWRSPQPSPKSPTQRSRWRKKGISLPRNPTRAAQKTQINPAVALEQLQCR
jgi:hypothetical protein